MTPQKMVCKDCGESCPSNCFTGHKDVFSCHNKDCVNHRGDIRLNEKNNVFSARRPVDPASAGVYQNDRLRQDARLHRDDRQNQTTTHRGRTAPEPRETWEDQRERLQRRFERGGRNVDPQTDNARGRVHQAHPSNSHNGASSRGADSNGYVYFCTQEPDEEIVDINQGFWPEARRAYDEAKKNSSNTNNKHRHTKR